MDGGYKCQVAKYTALSLTHFVLLSYLAWSCVICRIVLFSFVHIVLYWLCRLHLISMYWPSVYGRLRGAKRRGKIKQLRINFYSGYRSEETEVNQAPKKLEITINTPIHYILHHTCFFRTRVKVPSLILCRKLAIFLTNHVHGKSP